MLPDKPEFQHTKSTQKLKYTAHQAPSSQCRYRVVRASSYYANKKVDDEVNSVASNSLSSDSNQQSNSGVGCIQNATVYISYDRYKQSSMAKQSPYTTINQGSQGNQGLNHSAYSRVDSRADDLEKQLKNVREIKEKNQKIYKQMIASLQEKLKSQPTSSLSTGEKQKFQTQIKNLQKANKILSDENMRLRGSQNEISSAQYNQRCEQNRKLITQNKTLSETQKNLQQIVSQIEEQLSKKTAQINKLIQQNHSQALKLQQKDQTLESNKMTIQNLNKNLGILKQSNEKKQYQINELQEELKTQISRREKEVKAVKQKCAYWIHQLQDEIKKLQVSNSKLRAHKLSALKEVLEITKNYEIGDENTKNRGRVK